MNAEEELLKFKEFEKLALRKARTISVILGAAGVVTTLSVIYGITQRTEANNWKDEAFHQELFSEKQTKELNETKLSLENALEDVRKARDEVEVALKEAERIEFELAKKSKKK